MTAPAEDLPQIDAALSSAPAPRVYSETEVREAMERFAPHLDAGEAAISHMVNRDLVKADVLQAFFDARAAFAEFGGAK